VCLIRSYVSPRASGAVAARVRRRRRRSLVLHPTLTAPAASSAHGGSTRRRPARAVVSPPQAVPRPAAGAPSSPQAPPEGGVRGSAPASFAALSLSPSSALPPPARPPRSLPHGPPQALPARRRRPRRAGSGAAPRLHLPLSLYSISIVYSFLPPPARPPLSRLGTRRPPAGAGAPTARRRRS
jgi:hypothetical protein